MLLMTPREKLAALLAELRRLAVRSGLGYGELSAHLGRARLWSHRIFTGQTALRERDLYAVADELGISVLEIWREVEQREMPPPRAPRQSSLREWRQAARWLLANGQDPREGLLKDGAPDPGAYHAARVGQELHVLLAEDELSLQEASQALRRSKTYLSGIFRRSPLLIKVLLVLELLAVLDVSVVEFHARIHRLGAGPSAPDIKEAIEQEVARWSPDPDK